MHSTSIKDCSEQEAPTENRTSGMSERWIPEKGFHKRHPNKLPIVPPAPKTWQSRQEVVEGTKLITFVEKLRPQLSILRATSNDTAKGLWLCWGKIYNPFCKLLRPVVTAWDCAHSRWRNKEGIDILRHTSTLERICSGHQPTRSSVTNCLLPSSRSPQQRCAGCQAAHSGPKRAHHTRKDPAERAPKRLEMFSKAIFTPPPSQPLEQRDEIKL